MAPGEAPQKRAQGRCRLDREPRNPVRAAGPQRAGVVDAVATLEGRQDEGQELVERPFRSKMVGQGGRQEEPRIGHQAVVADDRIEAAR